jgi:hypothetical protein
MVWSTKTKQNKMGNCFFIHLQIKCGYFHAFLLFAKQEANNPLFFSKALSVHFGVIVATVSVCICLWCWYLLLLYFFCSFLFLFLVRFVILLYHLSLCNVKIFSFFPMVTFTLNSMGKHIVIRSWFVILYILYTVFVLSEWKMTQNVNCLFFPSTNDETNQPKMSSQLRLGLTWAIIWYDDGSCWKWWVFFFVWFVKAILFG